MNNKEYKEMLDDICSEYCDDEKYCLLKEFLISSHPSPRLLLQMKCVEKFRYEKGAKEGREIKWDEGMKLWVSDGHAQKFASVYNENIKFREMYKRVME